MLNPRDGIAIDYLIGQATDDCASKAQRNAAAQRLVRYMRTLRLAQQATKAQRAAREKVIREAAGTVVLDGDVVTADTSVALRAVAS